MLSYSIVFRYGVERFVADAKAAGLDGLIIPDLPPPEAQAVCGTVNAGGLATSLLVAPTTAPERRAEIARLSTGFVYYLSVSGITGERDQLPARHVAQRGVVAARGEGVLVLRQQPPLGRDLNAHARLPTPRDGPTTRATRVALPGSRAARDRRASRHDPRRCFRHTGDAPQARARLVTHRQTDVWICEIGSVEVRFGNERPLQGPTPRGTSS